MADEMMTGYLAGQADNNNCNGGGMWGGDGSWIFAFLIIALIFGGNGFGWGNNGANGGALQGLSPALTCAKASTSMALITPFVVCRAASAMDSMP